MKYITRVLLSCCLLMLATASFADTPCAIALVGATVIDGNGGKPLKNQTILIEQRRISAIGKRGSIDIPECAKSVNVKGKYIVPGFVDTNVHMAMPLRAVDYARYFERLKDIAIEGAQWHLKHGVTSLRDSYGVMAPLLAARDEINTGKVAGARLFVAGNIVGWGGNFSRTFRHKEPETYFEEWANEQVTRGSGEMLMWKSPDELRQLMNAYIDQGVDFVKIGVTHHDQNWPTLMFSQRQLNAIVDTIHKRGLIAEAHATTLEGMVMAIEAGVDLIQHPEVIGQPISQEVLDLLDQKRAICSIHTNNHAGKAWKEVLTQKENKTNNTHNDNQTPFRQWNKREKTEKQIRDQLVENNSFMFRENAEKILKTNCTLTTATDNSMGRAPEFYRNPNKWRAREPGVGTLASIEGLVELGLSPSKAITAATKNGAIALNRLSDLGTIEKGKIADLVVLDANPLKNIKNIRKISRVMKEGQLIDIDALPTERIYYRDEGS